MLNLLWTKRYERLCTGGRMCVSSPRLPSRDGLGLCGKSGQRQNDSGIVIETHRARRSMARRWVLPARFLSYLIATPFPAERRPAYGFTWQRRESRWVEKGISKCSRILYGCVCRSSDEAFQPYSKAGSLTLGTVFRPRCMFWYNDVVPTGSL